jgi:hypothetical protein
LTLILVGGFLLACLLTKLYGSYGGGPYPSNSFLYIPNDAIPMLHWPTLIGDHGFGDFFEAYVNSKALDPYSAQSFATSFGGVATGNSYAVGGLLVYAPGIDHAVATGPSSYFPVTHVLLWPLAQLPYGLAFALYVALFVGATVWLMWRFVPEAPLPTRLLQVAALVGMSAPVLLVLDRGNIEGLLFLFVFAAVLAFRAGRHTTAGLLLAVPIAMKGAPAVLWLLFVRARRWRALAWSAGAVVVGTAFSLLIFAGSFGHDVHLLRQALEAAGSLTDARTSGTHGVQHAVSLNALLSVLAHLSGGLGLLLDNSAVLAGLGLAAGAVLALTLPIVLWQQVALLLAVMLLTPALSFEYRMVHLLVPLALFLQDRTARPRALDAAYVALFGLLLMPKGPPILFEDVTTGPLLNPLLLLALIGVITADGLSRSTLPSLVATARLRPGARA